MGMSRVYLAERGIPKRRNAEGRDASGVRTVRDLFERLFT